MQRRSEKKCILEINRKVACLVQPNSRVIARLLLFSPNWFTTMGARLLTNEGLAFLYEPEEYRHPVFSVP